MPQKNPEALKVRVQGAPGAIAMRMEFTNSTGSISGGYATPRSAGDYGKLPIKYRGRYTLACRRPKTYIVRSEGTPIAWHTIDDNEGHHTWTIVPEIYTTTTAKHVALMQRAVKGENEHAALYGFTPARLVC